MIDAAERDGLLVPGGTIRHIDRSTKVLNLGPSMPA